MLAAVALSTVLLIGTGSPLSADSLWTCTDEKQPINLVDPKQEAAFEASGRWEYQELTSADLDGDGSEEKLVLVADVPLNSDGQPSWDDGQPWEVRIEEANGNQTRVYAQYVQLGHVWAGVVREEESPPKMLLIEETDLPRIRVFQVRYLGPGQVDVCELLDRQVERWLRL